MDQDGELLSLADAAAYLRVSERTVRNYIAAGRLDAYRVGPRVIRVYLDQVESLVRPIQRSPL